MALLQDRWQSLDALRGLTIAGMILVNNPGQWGATWPILKHAAWDGITLADFVFPFFLFIMGASLHLATARQLAKGMTPQQIFQKGVVRALKLIGIGIGLGLVWNAQLDSFRILGVLQRIGLVYLGCLAFYLWVPQRLWVWYMAMVSAGAWLLYMLMMQYPYINVYAVVDTWALGSHIYAPKYPPDPEGIVSTLTAMLSGMAGIQVCKLMLAPEKRGQWLAVGLSMLLMGVVLHLTAVLPINKVLWSPSFVLVTAGMATLLLGGAAVLEQNQQGNALWRVLVPVGLNPILVYTLSELGQHVTGKAWAFDKSLKQLFAQTLNSISPFLGFNSFLWSALLVAFWVAVAHALHARRLYWKV